MKGVVGGHKGVQGLEVLFLGFRPKKVLVHTPSQTPVWNHNKAPPETAVSFEKGLYCVHDSLGVVHLPTSRIINMSTIPLNDRGQGGMIEQRRT